MAGMPYTPVQGLTVALFNAGATPSLQGAVSLAAEVLQRLETMGFELLDVRHTPEPSSREE